MTRRKNGNISTDFREQRVRSVCMHVIIPASLTFRTVIAELTPILMLIKISLYTKSTISPFYVNKDREKLQKS